MERKSWRFFFFSSLSLSLCPPVCQLIHCQLELHSFLPLWFSCPCFPCGPSAPFGPVSLLLFVFRLSTYPGFFVILLFSHFSFPPSNCSFVSSVFQYTSSAASSLLPLQLSFRPQKLIFHLALFLFLFVFPSFPLSVPTFIYLFFPSMLPSFSSFLFFPLSFLIYLISYFFPFLLLLSFLLYSLTPLLPSILLYSFLLSFCFLASFCPSVSFSAAYP